MAIKFRIFLLATAIFSSSLVVQGNYSDFQKGNLVNIDSKNTVFLVDGSSFLYRAYYGLRPLQSSKGVPVQAVFSFCRMIKKLVDQFAVENIVLVWDSKGATARHDIFPDYKATRQAPPSDLFQQKDLIVQFAGLIGMRQLAKTGVEADDLMFSVAQEQSKAGKKVVFVTSDKDMGQALDDKVTIFDPFKDLWIDVPAFEQKMGFSVAKLPFYFALLGDTSDNIPGVKGIGEKGATELVKQFDSLEELYQNLDKVSKPRTRAALEENKENAFLSQKLFLFYYVPSNLTFEDYAFDRANWVNARPLFAELDFKSLVAEIDKAQGATAHALEDKIAAMVSKYNLVCVTTQQALDAMCAELKKKKAFALDTEGLGLSPLTDPMIGISFCADDKTAYYVPFAHKVAEQQLPREVVIAVLKPILEDAQYQKYLHNTKFDALVLHAAGIELKGVTFDTLLAASLLVKDGQRIGLKSLSQQYLGDSMLSFEEVVKQNKYKDFSQVPLALATTYSASDSLQTFRLVALLQEQLKKEGLLGLYEKLEHPLMQVLCDMEIGGIAIDVPQLNALNVQVTADLQKIETEILAFLEDGKTTINLNSPKQVEDLLFYQLKLPPQKKSAKRTGYSTDVEVLTILSAMHPVPGLIIKYRELAKLKTTYIEALPTYVNPITHKIHTSFSQTAVATGRLASSDPNLQNIPTNGTGFGIEVRAAFKPAPGKLFLSADYSQIELRVLAQLSHDETLIKAFLSGLDIHAQTASRLFDVPLNQVTNEQRQIGKRINFSILYGLTPFGLAKDLNIPFGDAKKYIEKYFEQYPQVSTWMEATIEQAKELGYVTTFWGRRRYTPGLYEHNRNLYDEARRIAINTVAQGTAAEIMKIGMINLDKAFKARTLDARIVLQIHDELLIEVAKEQLAEVEALVKQVLESVVSWNIPLVVTTRSGVDWKDVTK